jgi:hypothetical protein
MDFHENVYWKVLPKSVNYFQFWLTTDTSHEDPQFAFYDHYILSEVIWIFVG